MRVDRENAGTSQFLMQLWMVRTHGGSVVGRVQSALGSARSSGGLWSFAAWSLLAHDGVLSPCTYVCVCVVMGGIRLSDGLQTFHKKAPEEEPGYVAISSPVF